ncbi:MAG: dTMP kinase, partial [Mycobacteriaceae bacterium]|nr:dTMP kinase [Mycobacteriaceae bacterium]
MKGSFISFEGGDGAGKTTQVRLLAARLREMGIDVTTTREPGGSAGAETIRGLLLSTDSTWGMRAEALLFAAGRADHVEKTIQPALERGEWVISDRYVDSSRAYQGAAGGLGDEHVMTLHAHGAALMPDRTILLRFGAAHG